MEEIIVIGIDIGSTSIKVGAYRSRPHDNVTQVLEIVSEKYPNDAFESLESHGYHQMNFILLLETIEKCMERLKHSYRMQAKKLGICGQMHGIIFWNENTSNDSIDRYPWNYDPVSERFTIDHKRFSSFITWQDSRCSQDFIRKLITDNNIIAEIECREDLEGSNSRTDSCCGQLSNGFGFTTALWFVYNDKEYLNRFNRCGTPMTIILMMLKSINCTLEDLAILDQTKDKKSALLTMNFEANMCQSYCISDQIAASWGFYNIENSSWREKSLQRLGFPVKTIHTETNETGESQFLLPKILPSGTYLGLSRSRWLLLPKGIELYVENGDMQCSARVCLSYRSKAAILNISTSVQMAIVLDELPSQQLMEQYPALTVIPYLRGKFLLVAASLNGGNVLQKFVESVHGLVCMFAKSESSSLQVDDIWNILLSHKPANKPSVIIDPRIFGERHDPTLTGSIQNIKGDNLNVATIMSSLCHGIINNILTMMPSELLRTHNIEQIVCIGSVIRRNSLMRSILEATFRQLDIRVNFLLTADAQEGAAKIVIDEVH